MLLAELSTRILIALIAIVIPAVAVVLPALAGWSIGHTFVLVEVAVEILVTNRISATPHFVGANIATARATVLCAKVDVVLAVWLGGTLLAIIDRFPFAES